MPTITSQLEDLSKLAGRKLEPAELTLLLDSVKGEFKGQDPESGELRIELNDTNRPDLWCTEGIARQLRVLETGKAHDYDFGEAAGKEMHVEWIPYRPFAACFVARGLEITEEVLIQIIQTQEKLTDNFGHRRKSVSIGVYDASEIEFPVHYRAVGRHDRRFTPLGEEREMDLEQVLSEHPKGREYAHILAGEKGPHELVPILEDASGKILSFPPVINSRALGEVEPGDDTLMIEVTGTDLVRSLLVLGIFAANLADRGATIEPVTAVLSPEAAQLVGEELAPGGRAVAPPRHRDRKVVEASEVRRLLGEPGLSVDEIVSALRSYGVDAGADGETIEAQIPQFRNDYLHAVDVIEDFAIARGYSSFEPVMPHEFTVGNLSPETLRADRVRDILLSFGFEELISNVLTNRVEMRERMGLSDEPLVAIANIMSETYSVVRDAILPLLLRAEAASSMALYPHRIFEVGEVAVFDPEAVQGSRTEHRVAVALAHSEANFSEVHGYLERLAYELGLELSLEPVEHPSTIPGRAGTVMLAGEPIGLIGEMHPAVLDAWQIKVPVAAFEILL